jgi:TolA-binding protein
MGKKKTKKQEAKATLSEVVKEMAKPRVAESAREDISEWRSTKAVEQRTR